MCIEIAYKGEWLGHIEPDPIQDAFPWYQGTLIPTAAFAAYRQFFAWYEGDFDQPYHPFDEEVYEYFKRDDSQYPRDDEQRYRMSDLYGYVEFLKCLQQAFHSDNDAAVIAKLRAEGAWDIEDWVARWESDGYDDAAFAAYLEFLDYRNWKITADGQEVPWFPYPPNVNADDLRIAWR